MPATVQLAAYTRIALNLSENMLENNWSTKTNNYNKYTFVIINIYLTCVQSTLFFLFTSVILQYLSNNKLSETEVFWNHDHFGWLTDYLSQFHVQEKSIKFVCE